MLCALRPHLLLVGTLCAGSALAVSSLPVSDFKIFLREDGVYQVTYEDLVAAGWSGGPVHVGGLGVSRLGVVEPIFVEHGGDFFFGPGDHLELVGRHLAGEGSYYAEETAYAVYWLRLFGGGERYLAGEPAAADGSCLFATERHLEEDRMLLRFNPRQGEIEPWYWTRLSYLPRDNFSLPIALADLDRGASEPLEIEVALRGWSTPRLEAETPSHLIEGRLGTQALGPLTMDRQDEGRLAAALPAGSMVSDEVELALSIPRRTLANGDPIVDVAMLNWIELRYPRDGTLRVPQSRLVTRSDEGCQELSLSAPDGERITVYAGLDRAETALVEGRGGLRLRRPARELWAVVDGQLRQPEAIEQDRPSALRSRFQQADYLMVVHPTLAAALEPLAELHRRRGLSVAVVEVDDIYDEFSHGIVDPAAIREFVAYARREWAAPAPRFLLLAGDASWDARNAEIDDRAYADWTWRSWEKAHFVKNSSSPHPRRPTIGHRNLVPTFRWQSSEGHAAADSLFVEIEGDDELPDLAVGRFPVTEPDEIAAIVEKIRRYLEESPVGPWRQRALWIANEQLAYQRTSDLLAEGLGERGYGGSRIYPQPEETSNELHQGSIREAFDDGQLLVHFVGHGGRYIWRTGPPDVRKNHDLFTLEDVEKLAPTAKLPVILSMTCYSAPFDHPSADSIGEKFLRLPDRGAIAVLAASWRISPGQRLSETLLHHLLEADTVGEALLEAKREFPSRPFVAMFNLLGDPALPLARPARSLEPRLDGDRLRVDLPWPGPGTKALLQVLGAGGELLSSRELETEGQVFEWTVPDLGGAAREVTVYLWNAIENDDALGAIRLAPAAAVDDRVADNATLGATP